MSDLSQALDLWRRTRHEEFELVISALTPRAEERGPPPAGTVEQRHQSWLEVARRQDPADVRWLLDSLLLPNVERSARRLDWLRSVGPHPLVGEAGRRWLVAGHFRTLLSHRWWELLRQVSAWSSHDVDFGALAERIRRHPNDSMQRLARVVSAWKVARVPHRPPNPEEAERLVAWTPLIARQRARTARDSTADDLLAAVFADPDADGPRAVLADYLIGRGDPRGEFLRLQLARHAQGGADEALSPAEEDLLARHGEQWFGAHFVRMTTGTPERGFFARVGVGRYLHRLATLAEDVGLRTVRHLEIRRDDVRSDRGLHRLLASEQLPNLLRVGVLRPVDLAALVGAPARPRWIRLRPVSHLGAVAKSTPQLPSLQRLDLLVHPDRAGTIGDIRVPTLGLELRHWLAPAPGRTRSMIPDRRWPHRLEVALSAVHRDVQRLIFFGERDGIAVRRTRRGWGLDLAPLSDGLRAPWDPTYLSLALCDALGLPVAPDPSPHVAYRLDVGASTDKQPETIADLPPRPVFLDGEASAPRLGWLLALPRVPELRIRDGSDRLLRYTDSARRFETVRIVRGDGSLGPVLARGDDGRLRYAWGAGGVERSELVRLGRALGRTIEPIEPPGS